MTKPLIKLSKFERLKLCGLCIKAASGVIGGSMILTETRPILTLVVLTIGAVANELVSFLKEKELKIQPSTEQIEENI